jgi:hypothetical protein
MSNRFSQIPPSRWGVEAFIRLLRGDPPEEERSWIPPARGETNDRLPLASSTHS